ncbi:MAG: hypothetical protein IJI27_09825 [Oscillospiraceae bacterium]|nr:hypothetical protein [Oscillospiraceae bacterium]
MKKDGGLTMDSTINGVRVPHACSVAELAEMCRSGSMQDFTVAAEALGAKDDDAAFHILASYLSDRDKYKRLCAFNVIGNTRYASEITGEIESALSSPDALFRRAALRIAAREDITVSEEGIRSALWSNDAAVDANVYAAAEKLSVCEENYTFLNALFLNRLPCMAQEILAEVLLRHYSKTHAGRLFELFAESEHGKIRCLAVDLAKAHDFDVSRFQNDTDGHVRQRLK